MLNLIFRLIICNASPNHVYHAWAKHTYGIPLLLSLIFFKCKAFEELCRRRICMSCILAFEKYLTYFRAY